MGLRDVSSATDGRVNAVRFRVSACASLRFVESILFFCLLSDVDVDVVVGSGAQEVDDGDRCCVDGYCRILQRREGSAYVEVDCGPSDGCRCCSSIRRDRKGQGELE